MAREILEKIQWDSDESIISLDVEIWHTNVANNEVVEIVHEEIV